MGNSYYTQLTSTLCFTPNSISKGKVRLKEILENLITQTNIISQYNPVGLPISIEIFQ